LFKLTLLPIFSIIKFSQMNYVLIRNGSVVSSAGIQISDVLIGNNKIIEIAQAIPRPDPETPVIDASGKYVLPGAIDTNRNFSEFGVVLKDEMLRLCRAQIIGGTTSMLENLEPKNKMNSVEGIYLSKNRSAESIIDYGFHLSVNGWTGFSEKDLEYCFAHEGITTFSVQDLFEHEVAIEGLVSLMKKIKKLSLLLLVEVSHLEYVGSGYSGMSQTDDNTVSTRLNQLGIILDKIVETGCTACFLNISFKEELDLIINAQKKHKIFAELTMPCYIGEGMDFIIDNKTVMHGFSLTRELTLIPYSQFWSLLKDEQFLAARPSLRVSSVDDSIDKQVFNRPDEYFVLKNALSVLYTSGVANDNISISDFCNLTSEKPAKLMGLFPQKGIIRPGSDADIVIWDADVDRNLYCSYPRNLKSEVSMSKLKGKAQFVFANGIMAYDGDVFYGENLKGQYIYRISAERML